MTKKHFGYWIFGKDMNNVNITQLKKFGVTDVFLNFYAFTTHGKSKVQTWIKNANNNNINVHIWVQCFYDGEWHNPATTNLNTKLKEINNYTKITGVKGIHLDYLRYPGNAYQIKNGAQSITNFVKKVRSQNPKVILSCAIMPESEGKYYYGQDIDALGKVVDAIIPMQYKGNYGAGTNWLASTTKNFSKKATIWSGLQAYKSDNNTQLLSNTELTQDIKTCLSNGAQGVILFRHGLSINMNFKSFSQGVTMKINPKGIRAVANATKQYIEKNKKFTSSLTVGTTKLSYGQIAYILSYGVLYPNKTLNVSTIKNAPSMSGNSINENITQKDYKDMAKRLYQFIKTNQQCPNYVTTLQSKKKMTPRNFIYMLSRILSYYYSHNNTFPKSVKVQSSFFTNSTKKNTAKSTVKKVTTTVKKAISKVTNKSTAKLNAYMTNTGCSGMGQCTEYYCACNSIQQCYYRLTGIKVSESTIASAAGTTREGTDHNGINTAISWLNKKYNTNVKITWSNFSDLGNTDAQRWTALQNYINKGAVFVHLLYRDQYGHYEVPKSVGTDNLAILNSLGNNCGGESFCGYIETRSKSTQKSYIQGISQKSIAILTKG